VAGQRQRQRQRWGWHQLDPDVARRLVADARLPASSLVLDVGAGLGAITTPLVDAGHRVIAVEAHPARASHLRQHFGPPVTVVQADARDLRLPRRPFHVVANPPYGITADLLRRLLHRGSRLETARLVLDERAVNRWTSPSAPGAGRWTRDFEVVRGPSVPRRSFRPPPHVRSRVLVIRRRH
jgi:23S rRNA (adenine-N6)-dimethyltransferase